MTRYIFIFGGVMSGIGKGTTTASIGRLLIDRGFKVTAMKADPYVNVDAGTMNPIEHGEVFVTHDGLETDQDLGNYERFFNHDIPAQNYMTTGSVYKTVIERERNLEYNGICVEVVPHIPEEIVRRIKEAGRKARADFVLIEIGGTVGEYQNMLFVEAARVMKFKNPGRVMFTLVSYLPIPNNIGEMKTKPTQTASRTLNTAGIQADFIIARATQPIDQIRRKKLGIMCNVPEDHIISAPDADSIYDIPGQFRKHEFDDHIMRHFNMTNGPHSHNEWDGLVSRIKNSKDVVKLAIVGKYFKTGDYELGDSYISVLEAIKHACWEQGVKPEIAWINSEEYETKPHKIKELSNYAGVIVPQGWGSRGAEGKIAAIKYIREKGIPYFGLCYGMQMACIEFARNVVGLKNAASQEMKEKTTEPVIHVIPEQLKKIEFKDYGGSSRLGAYPCKLKKGTKSKALFKKELVHERHRHRYEFNNKYKKRFEDKGMVFAGINPDMDLVEIVELPDHPFFVGVQFHPEYISRPLDPHPLFMGFIKAAKEKTAI